MKTIIIPRKQADEISFSDADVSNGILVYDTTNKFIGMVVKSAVKGNWYIRSWDGSMDGYEREEPMKPQKYSEYDTLPDLIKKRPHYIFKQL